MTDDVAAHPLELSRAQILAYRRKVQALDERLPRGPESLRLAAWAGQHDSKPRAAAPSIHARVEETEPSTWDDASLVQLWGPRFQLYVVARRDLAPFSLGRYPDDSKARRVAEDLAARLQAFLDGRTTLTYAEAGRGIGEPPNRLRYAAPTGTVLIRWAGARAPTIWTVSRPDTQPGAARLELARRYLHVFGPATAEAFAKWAGIGAPQARRAFSTLGDSLTPVRTPIGDGWILTSDEPTFRAPAGPAPPARLLPSGDAYFLLWEAGRELLVPEAAHRDTLWTSRVWPGAVLVGGDVVGTWRRAGHEVSVQAWRRLAPDERAAVESEAASLPLPDLRAPISVRWGA